MNGKYVEASIIKRLMETGLSTKEISVKLGITQRTVQKKLFGKTRKRKTLSLKADPINRWRLSLP